MRRFVTSALVIAAGVLFIVVTLVQNLFPVGNAFEEMIDDFRPALQNEVIAQYREDVQGLGAVAEEFQSAVLPGLALALGQTPEQLAELMATRYPAVADGLAMLPQAAPSFAGLIDTLAAQQSNFLSADEIPTKNLPAQTVPWGFTIVGVIAIVIGVFMLVRGGRLSALLALVLGLLIVVGSLVLRLPGKSDDADDLNAALEPVYTVETVEGAKGALVVIGAMGEEMQTVMLPEVSEMLGLDQAAVEQFLSAFPATAKALETLPESMVRFVALVDTFDANLDNYDTLNPVRFTPIIWTFIVGGLVIAVAGLVGLVGGRREERAEGSGEEAAAA